MCKMHASEQGVGIMVITLLIEITPLDTSQHSCQPFRKIPFPPWGRTAQLSGEHRHELKAVSCRILSWSICKLLSFFIKLVLNLTGI